MVQAPLQVIQAGLGGHKLGPQSPTDVIDTLAKTLKVGVLALTGRPQQAQQLQFKPDWVHEIFAVSIRVVHDIQTLCPQTSYTNMPDD